MLVERSEPINSLPARGRGGVAQRTRGAAAAGRLCKAGRGPRSGWEGRAYNSPLVPAAALNADNAGVSLHRNFVLVPAAALNADDAGVGLHQNFVFACCILDGWLSPP